MEVKHTSGPWNLVIAEHNAAVFKQTTIALIGDEIDQCPANARLIAAAPDLLAVLVKAADWINAQITTSNEITDYDRAVFDEAQKAIAKATGEETP